MADFPYSTNPGNLKKFLDRIHDVGMPPKVDIKYLGSVGFRSVNDKTILRVIKALGFVDLAGAPTERWKEYRSRQQARQIMAGAIKTAYANLFETYPDAYRRDDKDLRNVISTHFTGAAGTVGHIVRTFRTLCGLADFEAVPPSGAGMPEEETAQSKRTPPAIDRPPTLNINIQLQLPATEDATIYDKLFEALKKHLLS